ncbi:unnamed protein product (macronuclear) [Paramecium tetraurelia]|uniref:VPS9 domain-containing protein n=1 Tax=Paramecium tetraurelia TaxID=5888 RepID=A0EF22_PARTE|nr:uncharacterized protein GSPATT00026236001 [Paramecium tetraurelia]CAK93913.1 unnamed protein product [Paramecium tetraurelia]|eukprot:XP_001461286.1 hypothetical protein (macronuclear) [Paramecium tetraurelia strain d4-2]
MGNVFCYERDDDNIEWKQQLESTCQVMKKQMCWAEPILIQLKDLRVSNKYQKQLHTFAQSYDESSLAEIQKSFRSRQSSKESRNIQTIIKRTGFTEEDLVENFIKPSRASFNLSIQSITPSYIYHEKTSNVGMGGSQVNFEDQMCFFVQITDKIKEHFDQPNELGVMIIHFRNSLNQQHQNRSFQYLHEQLTLFCRTLYDTIVIYYDMISIKKKYQAHAVLLNEETMLNFIVNYVMSNEGIYQVLYNSLLKEMSEIQKQTEQCFKQNKNITVEDMEIPKDFQLKSYVNPYGKAIQTLQKLGKKYGPSSKVKLIINFSQQIQQHAREGNENRGTSLLMQADDLLPIIKYILIKSQIYDIDVHLTYIEKLITNGMLNSTSGYYVVTLQAALTSLRSNLNQQQFNQQK